MAHRVVFMGTPAFACPALKALATTEGIEIPLVVTQPDRPTGRGRRMQSPPVKVVADALGLATYQTGSLRTEDLRLPIAESRPDLIVVAAFGLILGKAILELPAAGCVNLHASLLPAYRGASPISAAILNGDPQTGVTLMRMARGLDTGPMLAQSKLPIIPVDTTDTLTERLSHVAAQLLVAHVESIISGSLPAVPQPAGATLTRPLIKADGWIDWRRPADEIARHVRAMWSWPRAWTTLPDGAVVQIHLAFVETGHEASPPGKIETDVTGMRVACGEDWLRIDVAQLPGGHPLSGAQLARRAEFTSHPVLGVGGGPDVPGPLIRPA